MKGRYLFLAVVGFIAPYYFFIRFLAAEGLNLQRLVDQLFANPISTFFAVDLLIAAIVFWVFLYREAQRYTIKRWWLFIAATLAIGLSFALPLFLYVREGHRETRRQISS